MQTPLTIETLDERLESLPKDIRDAATSDLILERVESIGKNRGLHIDQVGLLGEETALLMLGETPIDGFSKHLASALGIASNIADAIVSDLNREIFSPIRGSLMSIQEKREAATPGPRDALVMGKQREQSTSTLGTGAQVGSTASQGTAQQTGALASKPIGQGIERSTSALDTGPLVRPSVNQSTSQPMSQSTAPPDPLTQKLTTATANPPEEVRGTPTPLAQKTSDPYREAVE